MSVRTAPTILELFRVAPVKSSLLTLAPLVLGVAQLANSFVTGFSPLVALGFAAVMVAFSVVATGHHAAELRVARLERSLRPPETTRGPRGAGER